MIYSTLVVAISAFASLATAQTNFTTCCQVNPATVEAPVRASWCRAQRNTCPDLCTNGQTSDNECDSDALTYTCTCATGNTPNVTDFGQTLPSLMCDEWVAQCTAANPNDLRGQTFCQSFICGSRNGTEYAASQPSTSASGSASAAPSASGSATESAAAATSSTAASKAVLSVAREYGTGAVVLGLLALFGLGM